MLATCRASASTAFAAETAARDGAVVIPAFAVGRTQEIMYHLVQLERAGRIPKLPCFIDSSMAMRATEVYRAHRQELDYSVGHWTAQYTPHQVMMMLQRAGIAAGAVQSAEDLYCDPHLRERGFAREVFHPRVGWLTRAGATVRFGGRARMADDFAHAAGEDNEAVLGDLLGMSGDQIRDLVERQVLR